MANHAPWPQAALFDLDGTLIDSVPDIAVAVGELLATEGLPGPTDEAVRGMVGRGMPVLVERAFAAAGRPLGPADHAAMVKRMMTIYPHHLTDRTTLMPGVIEALDFLDGRGTRCALVTNKPHAFTEAIMTHFGLASRFALVLGDEPLAGGARLPPKPAPDMLLHALRQLQAEPASAIMVGDSESDLRAAQAAGVFAVAVRGGYSATPLDEFGPDLLLDSLADLPRRLPEAAPTTR